MRAVSCEKKSSEERHPSRDGKSEEFLEFFAAFADDVDVVVVAQKTGLQLTVGCDAKTVAKGAELVIVHRSYEFHLGTVDTVLLAVMHPSGDNRLRARFKALTCGR